MKEKLFKRFLDKLKRNTIVSFLFFLLVSCSLWLSLTLNRKYETNIPITVYITNLPDNIRLEDYARAYTTARFKGNGTDLFGYLFGESIIVPADYSLFTRNGGTVSLSTKSLESTIAKSVGQSLSLVSFSTDSVSAQISRVTESVPVLLDTTSLSTTNSCEILSVRMIPDKVEVTALIDEFSRIEGLWTEPLDSMILSADTIFDLEITPWSSLIAVEPLTVKAEVDVVHYLTKRVTVPVEYVGFPQHLQLDMLPKSVVVTYEVLETNVAKVVPDEFLAKVNYDDYSEALKKGTRSISPNVGVLSSMVRKATSSAIPVMYLGVSIKYPLLW